MRAVEHDPLVSNILSPEDIQIRTINKFYLNHKMSAGAELGSWEEGSANTAGWQPEDEDLGEVLR